MGDVRLMEGRQVIRLSMRSSAIGRWLARHVRFVLSPPPVSRSAELQPVFNDPFIVADVVLFSGERTRHLTQERDRDRGRCWSKSADKEGSGWVWEDPGFLTYVSLRFFLTTSAAPVAFTAAPFFSHQ